MSCLLMVLSECACTNLIWEANFNLISRTEYIMCFHIMFLVLFQNFKDKDLSKCFGYSVRAFGQYIFRRKGIFSHVAYCILRCPKPKSCEDQ